GGRTTDPRGALTTMMSAPAGRVLLGAIAVGFIAFAAWKLAQAIKAPGGEKTSRRVGAAFAGLAAASLGLFAAHLAWPKVPMAGGGGGGGNAAVVDWTARLMEAPGGRVLVALVGLGVIAYGVSRIVRGWRHKFLEDLETGRMNAETRRWVERLGQAGFAAFGAVAVIIGAFLTNAAWQARPQEARGLSGALAALAAPPLGDVLLAVVAIGLAAYGAYHLLVARYQRVGPIIA
ncbi:MAG: DUF1206 domain-containing protein, partial [Candidatus Sericytochromatia bacterium]